MSDKRRTVLMLDEDAANILDKNASQRTKGVWLSDLIRRHEELANADDGGILERIEARVIRIERRLEG